MPYTHFTYADPIGYKVGVWLFWNERDVQLQLIHKSYQAIHALVKVSGSNSNWIISGIYASPHLVNRLIFWDQLWNFLIANSLPWVLLGDFNEIICASEKLGSGPLSPPSLSITRIREFRKMLGNCNVLDLGFERPRFTWLGKRVIGQIILECLDTVVCNHD